VTAMGNAAFGQTIFFCACYKEAFASVNEDIHTLYHSFASGPH